MRSSRLLIVSALLPAVFLLFSCGDTADREEVTAGAALDGLPLLPGSEPFGPLSTKDGVATRSFQADGAMAVDVVSFYREELIALGWEEADPVYRSATGHRADFVDPAHRLEVSATDVDQPASVGDRSTGAQYSLVLRPR